MLKQVLTKSFLFSATALFSLIGGCYNNPSSVSNEGFGSAQLKIMAMKNSDFIRLSKKAILTISSNDISIIKRELTLTDSSVEGSVTGIPAGPKCTFTIDVYDSANVKKYSGTTKADVVADSTVKIFISIKRLTGNAIIEGEIEEATNNHNLVAHWSFDQIQNTTVMDESGNDHYGILVGTKTIANGIRGKSLYFDGNSNYVRIDNKTEEFNLQQYTIDAWIMPVEMPSTDMFVYSTIHTNNNAGNCILFREKKLMSSQNASGWCYNLYEVSVMDKKWHHVAFSFNGTIQSIYLDGNLIDSWLCSDVIYYDGTVPTIGGSPWQRGDLGFFKGLIDEVHVWREALEPTTIRTIYESGVNK